MINKWSASEMMSLINFTSQKSENLISVSNQDTSTKSLVKKAKQSWSPSQSSEEKYMTNTPPDALRLYWNSLGFPETQLGRAQRSRRTAERAAPDAPEQTQRCELKWAARSPSPAPSLTHTHTLMHAHTHSHSALQHLPRRLCRREGGSDGLDVTLMWTCRFLRGPAACGRLGGALKTPRDMWAPRTELRVNCARTTVSETARRGKLKGMLYVMAADARASWNRWTRAQQPQQQQQHSGWVWPLGSHYHLTGCFCFIWAWIRLWLLRAFDITRKMWSTTF